VRCFALCGQQIIFTGFVKTGLPEVASSNSYFNFISWYLLAYFNEFDDFLTV
jgi:hypothetical protein